MSYKYNSPLNVPTARILGLLGWNDRQILHTLVSIINGFSGLKSLLKIFQQHIKELWAHYPICSKQP